jgi:glycosyltransferase involved in cell wall biosynthesis
MFNIKSSLKTICTYTPLRAITLYDIRKLYRALYTDSAKIVLLSERYIPIFEKIAGIKSVANKIIGIPNMLSFPTEDEIPRKKKQILWCGRLAFSQKRPDRMLHIWQKLQHKLPDWELVMVGGGPIEDLCKEYAKKLGLERIKFEGFQNPIPYYKDASIFALTSNHEGWVLVLNEAMQFGCVPVAYGNFEPIYDIITNDETGYIIKPFKQNEFIDRLYELAQDTNLHLKAISAQNSTQRYLPNIIGQEWLKLLKSISN